MAREDEVNVKRIDELTRKDWGEFTPKWRGGQKAREYEFDEPDPRNPSHSLTEVYFP